MPDKLDQLAKEMQKGQQTQSQSQAAPQSSNDDWKVWQAQDQPDNDHPIIQGAEDLGVGALKGIGSTLSSGDQWARQHLPAFMTNSNFGFGKPADLTREQQMLKPTDTMQTIGKGAEQAGEFLIPGGAEEVGAEKLAAVLPKLGKFAAPVARIATSATTSGAVNKVQGGDFSTGAEFGAGGGAVGEGMRAAAPIMAESAIQLPKRMRGFGRTTGRTILDETTGLSPEAVGESAGNKIDSLYNDLEGAVNRKSVRPNRVRGLLPAPAEEIPLHNGPDVDGQLWQPMVMTQADRPMPKQLPVSTRTTPMSSHTDIFPDQLPSGTTNIPSVTPTPASGMGAGDYIGQVPGYNGTLGTPQGVLIRPPEIPVGARPIPEMVPNASASLRPARNILRSGMDKAVEQNYPALHDQLEGMNNTLDSNFQTGEAYPETVTPRDLLNLKRGFSGQHLTWNPNIHEESTRLGRQAYNALDSELDRTVPEAQDVNQRISSLIPAKIRGESLSRESPLLQKMGQRVAARTGAAASGIAGGFAGYREGGVPGALIGTATGIAAPELIYDPTAQMAVARTINKPGFLRPLVGGVLQLARPKDDDDSK